VCYSFCPLYANKLQIIHVPAGSPFGKVVGWRRKWRAWALARLLSLEGNVHLLYGWGMIIEVCFPWNAVARGGGR